MRIDPNGLIGGCPTLVVRKVLRHLRVWDQWGVAEVRRLPLWRRAPAAIWSRLSKRRD